MPIARINSSLVYFAHVPKCAGTAVEDYLRARFGALGMLNRSYLRFHEQHRWTSSSPQHVDVAALENIFPEDFFSAQFAVVRNPIDRIVSVFRYQRDIEGTIAAETEFLDWLKSLESLRAQDPYYLDNHTRPAVDIVPHNAEVFKLEDGLGKVVEWIDEIAGDSEGPRNIGTKNTYLTRIVETGKPAGRAPEISNAERDVIAQIFAQDFERFGYAVDNVPA